jgi:hypothetical protein
LGGGEIRSLPHRRRPKKSPSGVAPEGQSRVNAQDPLGAPVTAETTETEAMEMRPERAAGFVVPGRIMKYARKKTQAGRPVKPGRGHGQRCQSRESPSSPGLIMRAIGLLVVLGGIIARPAVAGGQQAFSYCFGYIQALLQMLRNEA